MSVNLSKHKIKL